MSSSQHPIETKIYKRKRERQKEKKHTHNLTSIDRNIKGKITMNMDWIKVSQFFYYYYYYIEWNKRQ